MAARPLGPPRDKFVKGFQAYSIQVHIHRHNHIGAECPAGVQNIYQTVLRRSSRSHRLSFRHVCHAQQMCTKRSMYMYMYTYLRIRMEQSDPCPEVEIRTPRHTLSSLMESSMPHLRVSKRNPQETHGGFLLRLPISVSGGPHFHALARGL